MNETQILLVQKTWRQLEAHGDTFVNEFYHHLFELGPHIRPLFKRNINMQGRKILSMIGSSIEHIDRLDQIIPPLLSSGGRHTDYGVTPNDFRIFRQALLDTIGKFLGDEYDDATEQAWISAYSIIESVMVSAMRRVA